MSLSARQTEQLLAESGALLEGHFLLSSGLHSARYLQCALLLADPRRAERVGSALAALQKERPDLVVSPALGGLVIGHEVARALGLRAYFAERENGIMTLRRGFRVKPGEKIVVVEDVITTGKSSAEVVDLLRGLGGNVIGALSIIDRSTRASKLDVPAASLLKMPIESHAAASCPLCEKGIPAVKPGSRAQPKTTC